MGAFISRQWTYWWDRVVPSAPQILSLPECPRHCFSCGKVIETYVAREKDERGFNYFCSFRCFNKRDEAELKFSDEKSPVIHSDILPRKRKHDCKFEDHTNLEPITEGEVESSVTLPPGDYQLKDCPGGLFSVQLDESKTA